MSFCPLPTPKPKPTPTSLPDDLRQKKRSRDGGRRRRLLWRLLPLASLYAIRIACCFLPGYVHPDEFFQGGQELFFGCRGSGGRALDLALAFVGAGFGFGVAGSVDESVACGDTAFTSADVDGTTNVADYGTCTGTEPPDAEEEGEGRRPSSIDDLPWEFHPDNALRSVVPPLLAVYLPMRLYTWILGREDVYDTSGLEVLFVPRLWMCLLSFVAMDLSLYLILTRASQAAKEKGTTSSRTQRGSRHNSDTRDSDGGSSSIANRDDRDFEDEIFVSMLALASSWPVLVMAVRPFSNSLEAMILSSLLAVVSRDLTAAADDDGSNCTDLGARSHFGTAAVAPIVIGALSAFGFFARFTLAFFAAPVVLLFLVERGKKRNDGEGMTRREGGDCVVLGVERKACVSKIEGGADPGCATSETGAASPRFTSKAVEQVTEKRTRMATTYTSCARVMLSSWREVLLYAWGFVPTAAVIITVDAVFYHFLRKVAAETWAPAKLRLPPLRSHAWFWSCSWSFGGLLDYVTPLNALRYNSRVANLAEHGLHHRTNHLLVNFPMLFGPLAILFHANLLKAIILPLRSLVRCGFTSKYAPTRCIEAEDDDEGKGDKTATSRDSIVRAFCLPPIISGLAALSLAPHQEPRFLLPLTVPLLALHGPRLFIAPSGHGGPSLSSSSGRWSTSIVAFCWVAFNIALLTFFGVLHQGGVVPSVIRTSHITWPHALSTIASGTPTDSAVTVTPVTVVYYHTYMPPTFLLRGHQCAATKAPQAVDASVLGLSSDADEEVWTTWDFIAAKSPCNKWRGRPSPMRNFDARRQRTCGMAATSIVDLKGSSFDLLNVTISSLLRCSEGGNNGGDGGFRHGNVRMQSAAMAPVYVVAPPQTLEVDVGVDGGWHCNVLGVDGARDLSCRRLWSVSPHVTTEDLPPFELAGGRKDDFRTSTPHSLRRAFRLVLYEFECAHE